VSDQPTEESEPLVPGLTQPQTLGLERCPIRTRESGVTQAGWRLSVASPEGSGSIALVELARAAAVFRGDGVFLGWPQDRLAAAYAALTPTDSEPPFETAQLG
jgi:hypothetical protein